MAVQSVAGVLNLRVIEKNTLRYKTILSQQQRKDKQLIACLAFNLITNAWKFQGKSSDDPSWQNSIYYFLPYLGFKILNEEEMEKAMVEGFDDLAYMKQQEEMSNFTTEAFFIDLNSAMNYVNHYFSKSQKDALNWLLVLICNEKQEYIDARCHIARMILSSCGQSPIHLEYLKSSDGKKYVAFDSSELLSLFP